MCDVNLCVKHFALFNMRRTLVEVRETIVSLEKMFPIRGGDANKQNWEGKS